MGGVVALVVIAGLVFWLLRRRRANKAAASSYDPNLLVGPSEPSPQTPYTSPTPLSAPETSYPTTHVTGSSVGQRIYVSSGNMLPIRIAAQLFMYRTPMTPALSLLSLQQGLPLTTPTTTHPIWTMVRCPISPRWHSTIMALVLSSSPLPPHVLITPVLRRFEPCILHGIPYLRYRHKYHTRSVSTFLS